MDTTDAGACQLINSSSNNNKDNNSQRGKDNSYSILVIINVIKHYFFHQLSPVSGEMLMAFSLAQGWGEWGRLNYLTVGINAETETATATQCTAGLDVFNETKLSGEIETGQGVNEKAM